MRLAAIFVSNNIEQMSAEERERLMAHLDQTGVEPLVPGLGHLFYMADNWRHHDDVTEDEFETFRSEVVGALQGLDAQERSSRRVKVVLPQLFDQFGRGGAKDTQRCPRPRTGRPGTHRAP